VLTKVHRLRERHDPAAEAASLREVGATLSGAGLIPEGASPPGVGALPGEALRSTDGTTELAQATPARPQHSQPPPAQPTTSRGRNPQPEDPEAFNGTPVLILFGLSVFSGLIGAAMVASGSLAGLGALTVAAILLLAALIVLIVELIP
jgi:hypothetical protein